MPRSSVLPCRLCGDVLWTALGVIEHLRVVHPDKYDELRYCVYCSADCEADEVEHDPSCPDVTGLFPAGWPGQRCVRCSVELDVYVCLPIPDTDLLEVCCVGCAALATC